MSNECQRPLFIRRVGQLSAVSHSLFTSSTHGTISLTNQKSATASLFVAINARVGIQSNVLIALMNGRSLIKN